MLYVNAYVIRLTDSPWNMQDRLAVCHEKEADLKKQHEVRSLFSA